jgi:hypothetical protein
MTEQTAEAPARPTIGALAKALASFQAEMPTVTKNHTATVKSDKGSYSYTYAGLADVSEAAMPLLAKHGLSFSTLPSGQTLVGMLLHESGESLTASLPINGATPQQIGSSLTYMRRYLLGCMTGVVTDDDDDGQQAQQAATRRKPAQRQQAAPPPEPERPSNEISAAQLAKIGALMNELGIKGRDEALGYVASKVGRPVESRNDLSKSEAHTLIESLEADKAAS